MCMASAGVVPPKQWKHNADKVNTAGNTVAMLLA